MENQEKKSYETPEIQVVEMDTPSQMLLCMSPPKSDPYGGGNDEEGWLN